MTAALRDVVRRAVEKFLVAAKKAKIGKPAVGLVLGSGLKDLADRIEGVAELDPSRIEGFPKPSVPGHSGKLVAGLLAGVPVAAFVGRIHAYEGHPLPIVALPARFLCALAPRALVLTNAAGSLHRDWQPGNAMLIEDHLNLLGGSPLDGCRDEDFGNRFVDMGGAWPSHLRMLALAAAPSTITVREGVYAACRGPQYETPAEIRMLRELGADAVGMSTVPEAIVAAQMGVPALGISLMTNHAAGVTSSPLSHREVLEVGRKAAKSLSDWLEALVPRLAEPARDGKAPRSPRKRRS